MQIRDIHTLLFVRLELSKSALVHILKAAWKKKKQKMKVELRCW